MPAAWLMCPEGEMRDQRLPNRRDPNVSVSLEELRGIGVLVHSLDPETMLVGENGTTPVDQLMKDIAYAARDEVILTPQALPNYEEKLKAFFAEHVHCDDEVRLVTEGSGYFDVRTASDEWCRIAVGPGDVLVVPAGLYHRFTMDENNRMHALRLFQAEPKWTSLSRHDAEQCACRVAYEKKYLSGGPRPTLLGTTEDNISVLFPSTLDAVVRETMTKAKPGDVVALYFTGAHKLTLTTSWCPDCVVADPIVANAVAAARVKLAASKRRVTFVQCDVERGAYRQKPQYAYRIHPFVQLRCIPTLVVLRVSAAIAPHGGKKDDPFRDFELLYRKDDVLDDSWVALA